MSTRATRWICLCIALAQLMPTGVWAGDSSGPVRNRQPDRSPTQPLKDDPCAVAPGSGPDDAGADPGAAGLEGDPVRVASGRYLFTRTDLTLHGVFPIAFRRTYDSQSELDTPVGSGWSHNYDLRLFASPDGGVLVRKLCGGMVLFLQDGTTYTPVSSLTTERLSARPDGGYRLRYLDGLKTDFDSLGRLSAIEDRGGNRLEMTYTSGRPTALQADSIFTPPGGTLTTEGFLLQFVRERTADGTLTGRSLEFRYDASTGRLASLHASDGREIGYDFDAAGGRAGTRGNLTKVTGLEGIVETYGYGDPDPHNLTSAQFAPGMAALINVYDTRDRVSEQRIGSSRVQFDYSTPQVTVVTRTIVDDKGRSQTSTSRYEYDPDGLLLRLVDAFGNAFVNVRDADGRRMKYQVFPHGVEQPSREEAFTYTDGSQIHTQTVTLDTGEIITHSFEYDQGQLSATQVVSSADPAKIFRTEYVWEHDTDDLPTYVKEIRQRRDDGTFVGTSIEVNVNGQPTRVTPPALPSRPMLRFRKTYFPPDSPNTGLLHESYIELDSVRIANGSRTFEYDEHGFPSSVTVPGALPGDPERRSDVRNDLLGRPLVVTNPLGEQSLFTYRGPTQGRGDADFLDAGPGYFLVQIETGRLSENQPGERSRFDFDNRGRLVRTLRVEDLEHPSIFSVLGAASYDSEGQLLSLRNPLGKTLTYTYDLRGQLATETDGSRTSRREYEPEGQLAVLVDPEMQRTELGYDDLGRLVSLVTTGGDEMQSRTFGYDAAGNETSATDGGGQVTHYTFDALRQLRRIEQPLGQKIEFDYDDAGQTTKVVNARGNVLRFDYTATGSVKRVEERATAQADPTRVRTFDYDQVGNLRNTADSTLNSGQPLYTFGYDAVDRLTEQVAHYIPGPGGAPLDRTVRLEFDAFGNAKRAELVDMGVTLTQTLAYDGANRLRSSLLPSNKGVSLRYRGDDQVDRISYDKSVAIAFGYDPQGALDDIRLLSGSALDLEHYKLDYTRNPDFTIASLREDIDGAAVATYGYKYDGLRRAQDSSFAGDLDLPRREQLDYDAAGNLIDPNDLHAYQYDDNQRIVRAPGGRTYTSDDDGNVTGITFPDGRNLTFDYDATSQVESVVSSNPDVRTTFAYDPLGRRIRQIVEGQTTYFLWEGDRLLAEYDGSTGQRSVRYSYLTGSEPITVARTEADGSERELLALIDHRAAPRVLADANGNLQWRAGYSIFGGGAIDESPDRDDSLDDFPNRGQAQFNITPREAPELVHLDPSGLFEPNSGRHFTQDPSRQAAGDNPSQETGRNDLPDPADDFADLGPFPRDGSNYGTDPIDRFHDDPCPSPSLKPGSQAPPGDPTSSDFLTGLLYALANGKLSGDQQALIASTILGGLGFVPGLGAFADLLDALLSAFQGDALGVSLAIAAAIPFEGDATAGVANAARKLARVEELLGALRKLGAKLRGRCFVAGTPVLTPDGLVPIESLRVGDWVLSRDEQTNEVAPRKVVRTFRYDDKFVLDLILEQQDGAQETLGVTAGHPFWVREHGWVPAQKLLPGMEIYTATGSWVRVARSTWRARTETVYNIEVSAFHTYFVGVQRVWVHNQCALEQFVGVARSRINISRSGFADVLRKHFDGRLNKSQFSITPDDLTLIRHWRVG